jgi:hypothetical protein
MLPYESCVSAVNTLLQCSISRIFLVYNMRRRQVCPFQVHSYDSPLMIIKCRPVRSVVLARSRICLLQLFRVLQKVLKRRETD